MTAEIVRIDHVHPQAAFSRCRDAVSRGGVIIYPTDTFYALGVDPENARAVERLFEIKGRKQDQPILLLLHDPRQVDRWAAGATPEAKRLMRDHWPGPLTLVFTARPGVLPLLTAGSGTIGLRVPGNPLTRELLAFLGTALTGTSANVSGESSASTVKEIAAALRGRVDFILDAGPTIGGRPSTIADVSGRTVRVLREGAVKIPAS